MYSLIIHGRRLVEFQKLRNLRFSVNLLQNMLSNSFSSATAAADARLRDGRKGKTFTVSYLVDSLGLTTKLAESISRKVSSEGKGDPDSVLRLLRSHGFTDPQISRIIKAYPRLLIEDEDPEKSLAPKLQVLQSRGASTSELTEILSKFPKIFGKGEKTISFYYDLVKDIIEASKEDKIRNVSVLRELGVPQRLLLLISGRKLVYTKKERFEESLKKVVDMGFDPTTLKFVEALDAVCSMSNKTIEEEKVNVYKSLGFDVEDVWAMFKKWPKFLTYSEEKITQKFEILNECGLLEDEVCSVFKKFPQCMGVSEQKIDYSTIIFRDLGFSRDEFAMMVKRYPWCLNLSPITVKKKTEFLVKKMNWPIQALVSNPQVLGLSMEKRIVPRCNVIKSLMSKGLIGSELPPVLSVLVCTDEAFLNKYVRKYDDKELVAELMKH